MRYGCFGRKAIIIGPRHGLPLHRYPGGKCNGLAGGIKQSRFVAQIVHIDGTENEVARIDGPQARDAAPAPGQGQAAALNAVAVEGIELIAGAGIVLEQGRLVAEMPIDRLGAAAEADFEGCKREGGCGET